MILDLIIIAIIALSTYLGYKKGFVSLAIKLVALIISMIITILLYNPISNLVINGTNVDETIENKIYDTIIEKVENEANNENIYLGLTKEDIQDGMLPSAVEGLTINIVKLGVFIILFVLTKIIVKCINSLADKISSLPILSQFNKAGGIAYGLIRGILAIYIVLILVSIVTQAIPNNSAYEKIENSIVTKTMYENNILNIFFK